MSVDAESCPGAMTTATPERRDGVPPFARVTMQFKCPAETGKFAVINETLLVSAVDYELGGADRHLPLRRRPHADGSGEPGVLALAARRLRGARAGLGARAVPRRPAARRAHRARVRRVRGGVTAAYLLALLLAALRHRQRARADARGADRRLDRRASPRCRCSASPAARSCRSCPALALVHGLAFALAVPTTTRSRRFAVGLLLAQALIVTLAGALPLAWRARDRTPGAPARDRARSAAR